MPAPDFAPLAHALAGDYTVVTLDSRGIARSPIDDPEQDSTPELRADDVAAILDDLGAGAVDMFGSSGGAVTGLALVARHPGRVRTLVAHEPPLLALLADAAQHRANTEDIIATFHAHGPGAAWLAFMTNAGFDTTAPGGASARPEPSEQERQQQIDHARRFFDHELRATIGFEPDLAALRRGATRVVVVGVGVDSGPRKVLIGSSR